MNTTILPFHRSTGLALDPEQNTFSTVFADITHRCNMACHNCYIPNREIPDMDKAWLYGILSRLPRRTRIRLVGAEPTVRHDLPDIIREVRRLGHLPVLMSNGLRLSSRSYVRQLKRAGLRTIHLSLNGGLRDDLYEAIDNLRCAEKKLKALENLAAERMYVSAGMILIRGVNEFHLAEFIRHLRALGIQDLHIRSVGQFGRYLETQPFSLDELIDIACAAIGIARNDLTFEYNGPGHVNFAHGNMLFQATQWPEYGSRERGRLTPEGKIEPTFEHIVANAWGY
jgi:molybdenum cofactor biosynthesis enzyme MoaA